MNKSILHLDMDAFFASVEQAANPKLKNKPLIVGSRPEKYRTVVAACSYEAKAFGVKSGMSAKEAFRLCPQAIFVPADSSKYVYTAEKIFDLLLEFSPQVEMASIDEFNLDITGCQKIFGSTENIAYLIKQRLRQQLGLSGSIGIASNKLMAKLASKMDKPDGLLIWSKTDLPMVLQGLPVEKICGIGPKISAHLQQMSIFTCGQLAQVPEALLVERFGKYGLWLSQAARGEDSDKIALATKPDTPPKSVGHSYTLEKDIWQIDLIQAWIGLLCEMVAVRLRSLLLAGSVIHLYLKGPNLLWWSRQKTFSEPTSDGGRLYQRALLVLNGIFTTVTCVRALGVSVSGLFPENSGFLLEQDIKGQQLLFARDQINARFGNWAIYPAKLAII